MKKILQLTLVMLALCMRTLIAQNGPVTIAPAVLMCTENTVEIPIRVRDFNDVGAVSLYLTYNSLVITYQGFVNTSGYQRLFAHNPVDGIITIAGFASEAEATTLPDDAALISLTFTYHGGSTGLNWVDDGESCEYASWPDFIPYNDIPQQDFYVDGSVGLMELPSLTCPVDYVVNNDAGLCSALVNFEALAGGTQPIALTYKIGEAVITSPHPFQVGTSTVDVTAVNTCGTATCSFTVTVNDTELPDITCQESNQSVVTNAACTYVHSGTGWNAGATDNCGVITKAYTLNGATAGTGASLAGVTFNVGTTTVTWRADDAAGNFRECSFQVKVSGTTIAGNIAYYNTAGTKMNGAVVTLKQEGFADMVSAPADANGDYTLQDVCVGTWSAHLTTDKVAGSINSTDAALVNFWGTGTNAYAIEKVHFYCGDVVTNNRYNAADASRILEYFVTNGNPSWSARSSWTFWSRNDWMSVNPVGTNTNVFSPTLTVPAGVVSATHDFWALSTGDFNRSWQPPTKMARQTVTLHDGEPVMVDVGKEFELPLYAERDMNVGAVTLIMKFPAKNVQIKGISLQNNPTTPVTYRVIGDELRIAWFSPAPLSLSKGDKLLTIRLMLIEPLAENQAIGFGLADDPLNELADGQYAVIENAALKINLIKSTVERLSGSVSKEQVTLSCFPNPFSQSTTLAYTLPADGKVVIEIYDIQGKKIKILVDEAKTAGDYTLKIDTSTWRLGVYTACINLQANNLRLRQTIKLVRQH